MMLTNWSSVPDIALQDTEGQALSLADYRGTSNVLLYLMRSTSCPVCNMHVKDLVGKQDELRAANAR